MTAAVEVQPPADLTTADLLILWDQTRPRSQQSEFGMSELGGCRRKAGYRLAGTRPTNVGASVQAVLGTVIHEAVATVLKELRDKGVIPATDLIEEEVRFADILGHLDRYEADKARLRDTKTTSQRWLDRLRRDGQPTIENLWQVNGYAAALIAAGTPVRTVAIDYIARDTGDEWTWEGPFDPQHVRDALAWLRTVQSTELQFLPRDYAPDSAFCNHCPFRDLCWDGGVADRDERSVLYLDDPDAAKWARQLFDAREAKKAAEKLEAEAKGALDAIRTLEEKGSETVVVDGFDRAIRFTVSTPWRLNADQVRAEYAAAGANPPMVRSEQVKVDIVAIPEAGAA